MKYYKVWFLALVFFLLIPIPLVLASSDDFTFEDRVNEGVSVFFLVDLDEGEDFRAEVIPKDKGKFRTMKRATWNT